MEKVRMGELQSVVLRAQTRPQVDWICLTERGTLRTTSICRSLQLMCDASCWPGMHELPEVFGWSEARQSFNLALVYSNVCRSHGWSLKMHENRSIVIYTASILFDIDTYLIILYAYVYSLSLYIYIYTHIHIEVCIYIYYIHIPIYLSKEV